MIILSAFVLSVAVLLRALPLFQFQAWGIDFGIHSGLAQTFVDTGEPFPTYNGWGASYQYFPLLYWITGGLARLLGVPTSVVLPFIPLVFGSITAVMIFWIVLELTNKRSTAVLSGLLISANAIYICQTSHPYPLTLGHSFIMLLFALYFASGRRPWLYYLMFPAGILLLLSHHMSSYMFLIGFAGAVVFGTIGEKWNRWKAAKGFVFLGFQFIATLAYWYFFAPPLNRWVSQFFHIPLPLLALVGVFGLVAAYSMLEKLHPRLNRAYTAAAKRIANFSGWKLFSVFTLGWGLVFLIICIIGMGFLDLKANPLVFLMALPTILFLGAGCAGLKYLAKRPAVTGWFIAILVSLVFATATWTRALFPERHLEYLVEPLAISAGIAISVFIGRYGSFFWSLVPERLSLHPIYALRANLKEALPVLIICLIVLGGFISTPEIISGRYSQGITDVDQEAVEFIRAECPKNLSVATDHRLGVLINSSNGPPCTFEHTQKIWTSDDPDEYLPELMGNETHYPKVGYILIDDNMLNGTLTLVDNGPKGAVVTITDWEYEKFLTQPFEIVYRVEEKGHWAEVYKVNWTYVEKNFQSTSSDLKQTPQ